jgi:hypothetical protein
MSSDNTGEQQAGRFRKGQSGNPAGRPKGSLNRATILAQALIDGQSEVLTHTLIQMALERDPVAMRLSMERILPPRKDRPVSFPLRPINSARDAADAQSDVAAAVSAGEITPADAAEISKVLANAAKAFEIAEIAERAQLERMTDEELLRVIAMGDNGNEITKQVSGLLTIGPR